MTKQVNYSVLIGAIASNSACSEHEWIDLIKQSLNDIEDAGDKRIEKYQELGDKLWKEVEVSNIRVSNIVISKSKKQRVALLKQGREEINPQKDEKDDRSLQGWSDLILGERK